MLNVFDPSLPEINYFRSGKAQFPNNMNFKNLPGVFEIFQKLGNLDLKKSFKITQEYYRRRILDIRDIEFILKSSLTNFGIFIKNMLSFTENKF